MKKYIIIVNIWIGLIVATIFTGIIFYNYIQRSNAYPEQKEIIKTYIDDLYDTDCTVKKVSFTHNDIGFTAGLYQYYFEVYDTKAKITYKVSYDRYEDLSNETVKDVIIQ